MAVLDGIRVVVTGSAAALDMASLLLSDNGAEVIRVEPPGGDARRSLPAWRLWNRGARSIVLDPAVAADRAAAGALIDTADVLLEAQGGAAGLGWSFGYEALAARNPGLVHCTVTAFGRSGELSWLPPYDGVVEARSGANVDLGATLGRETPAYRARPNPSYATANIVVQSIAAALLVRERDGRGQHIDTSLYQGLLAYDFASALRRQDELGELDPPLPSDGGSGGAVPSLPGMPVQRRPVDADHQQHREAVPALDGGHRARPHLGRSALQGRPVGHPRPRGEGRARVSHPGRDGGPHLR